MFWVMGVGVGWERTLVEREERWDVDEDGLWGGRYLDRPCKQQAGPCFDGMKRKEHASHHRILFSSSFLLLYC